MTTSSQATAAAAPVEIDGKQYHVSPLSDREWAELDLWCQGRVIQIARASLPSDASEEDRRQTMAAAFENAAQRSWAKDGVRAVQTRPGLSQFVWRLLHRRHPELTLDEVAGWWQRDPDIIGRIMDAFALVSGAEPKKGPAAAQAAGENKPAQ